jgi:2-(1,2-epoxy-1,2-dihydrophenyl)acetyl-CoA isomerase
MDSFKTILYDKRGSVATITLNRPDRFNAFIDELHQDLRRALREASVDADVRAIVLTGAGKAFCSGQDLKEIRGQPHRSLGESLRQHYNPNILRLRSLEKPVICALNGVAAGAGMSLALACDVIVAGQSASMIQSFINVGLVPDSGSTWFLARFLGYHKAFEICTSGRKLDAPELQRLGLVLEVVPDADLSARARVIAERMASGPTKAIGLIKRALNRVAVLNLEQALEYEAYLQEIAGRSDDYQEGVAAFVEKRPPNFAGR